jgi:4-alpha-glucanotransferase
MNLPGSEGGNWAWRYDRRALTDELARELRALTASTNRL